MCLYDVVLLSSPAESPSGSFDDDRSLSDESTSTMLSSLSADIVEHMDNIGLGTSLKLASSLDKINDINESKSEGHYSRNTAVRRSSYENKQSMKLGKSPVFISRSKDRGPTKVKVAKKKVSLNLPGDSGRKGLSSLIRRSHSGRQPDDKFEDLKK